MRTIVVNNQKGGVGKTTIALHLAWHFVEQSRRVLFIDLDTQGNATSTLTRSSADARWLAAPAGAAAELFGDVPISVDPGLDFQLLGATSRLNSVDANVDRAVAAIQGQHQRVGSAFDYCVIDTPPAFGARNLGALLVCDHLIAPIQLEDYAMGGVNNLLKSISVAEKLRGRPLDFLGLLPSQFRANSNLHRHNLEMLVSALGRTDLLFPGFITLRQAYADAVARSLPVWAIRDNSAAAVAAREMRHVLDLIAVRLDRAA